MCDPSLAAGSLSCRMWNMETPPPILETVMVGCTTVKAFDLCSRRKENATLWFKISLQLTRALNLVIQVKCPGEVNIF